MTLAAGADSPDMPPMSKNRNALLAGGLAAVLFGMLGLSFASTLR